MPAPQSQSEPEDCSLRLCAAARRLRDRLAKLTFSAPVSHVYNPLAYAWQAYERYLQLYASTPKKILFLGMNPGPFGMVQTGIPFGEVTAVKGWLRIHTPIGKPAHEHSQRPVLGFECPRSEVSGRRLWQLFADRFTTAETFFTDHFVLNYCPLAFLEDSGRNRTPDKLPADELKALLSVCDQHLKEALKILQPQLAIGVGAFAAERLAEVASPEIKLSQILHPSPANPAANRDWAGIVTRQLQSLGAWPAK